MIAAGVRPLLVNGTTARLSIKKDTGAVRSAGQRKDPGSGVEMVDNTVSLQFFRHFLRVVFQLETVSKVHTGEVCAVNFDRERAADSGTYGTEFFGIFNPGGGVVDIHRIFGQS